MARPPAFAEYWKSVRIRLEHEFAGGFPGMFGELPQQQAAELRRLLDGGKLIRGCLTCLVSEALGGSIEDAIPRAVAVECIQAASLVHDDYVDGDAVRRDRSAAWTVLGPRKAVLLGDIVFAAVLHKMVETGREDGLTAAAALATLAQGAYRELHSISDAIDGTPGEPEPYDRIIHLKTGTLFGAAARLGAIAADASPHMRDLAFAFGANLGEAYQIADDAHDFAALKDESDISTAKLAAAIPMLRRFFPEADFPAGSLLQDRAGDLRVRLQSFEADLKLRMDDAIESRLALAKAAIEEFPENGYAATLRAAPAEIIRMMRGQAAGA